MHKDMKWVSMMQYLYISDDYVAYQISKVKVFHCEDIFHFFLMKKALHAVKMKCLYFNFPLVGRWIF